MKKVAALFLLFASLALYPQQAREDGRLGTAINPAPIGVWERIGPDGGGIEGLAFNPANPNEILATYRYPGRVYKSTKGGLTWSKLADHYDHLDGIAVNPANQNIVYMLGYSMFYISMDGGLTWAVAGLGAPAFPSGTIAVSPSDPNTIYVPGNHEVIHGTTTDYHMAVFKSTEGGVHWTDKAAGLPSDERRALSLGLDPTDPNVVYVSGYTSIYKTTNGGDSWADITGSIQGTVWALAIDPANPLRVYAGTPSAIYRSTDGGASWQANSGSASAYELALDPANPGTIYAGAYRTVYKSVDYGANWTSSSDGVFGACRSLVVSPAGLFFASGAGIFRSIDGGLSWQESHAGITEAAVPALAVAPSIPGTVFAEAAGGGLVKSSDFGNTWARLPSFNRCEYINKIIINPADANELLILSEAPSAYYGYDEILRSQDGGNTWTNIFSNRVEDIAVNKSDFDRIFAVGKNDASSVMALHKTTNGGAEWSTFDITSVQGESCAVDIDPTNDNTIYVGGGYYPSWSYVGCIFKSTDGGQSWTKVWEGKEDVKAIAVDPSFPARIYAGTHDGLYRSEDQGATWTLVLNEGVDSILVNPAAANEVFALDYYGVWFSTDWGATWQQMNTGLTTTPLCLDANWTNRILYAGMSGRAWNSEPTAKGGVFRTFLPGTPSMPTVSGFVKTAVGEGIPGVLLTFSAGGGTVTTGASGYYIQPVPAGWSGTVTPSKTGLIFAPADLTYTSVTSNQAGADYVGGVHAVSNPYIPSGLSRGEQGISYTFASGGSVCGLGHGVEYQFDWGDGTSSGWSAATSAAHAWPASGSYTLKAQARCSVDTGLVSGWSEGISVTILSQYTEADKYAVGDVDGDGRDEAAVDFGTLGVWLWNEGKWVKMTPTDPEHLVAGNLYGHDNDEIVGDFGADGIWRWNGSPWTLLSGQNPESMIVANTDGDAAEELFVDLGHFGTWLYDGPWWSQLIGVFAEYMAAADTDGDGADELAADLGYRGLWIWDGGTWTQWTEDDPEYIIGANTDGDSAGELVVDFGSLGLWLWNGGAWTYLSNDNPEFMAAGDTDGDGADEVAVDFGGLGVFLWNAGTWNYLTPDNPDFLLAADVDGDGSAEIVGDFGGIGLWLWESGTWTCLTGDNPQYLTAANTDGGTDSELIVDFGPLGLFLWNNNGWTCLTNDNADLAKSDADPGRPF